MNSFCNPAAVLVSLISLLFIYFLFTVRQDPLLGASEMFNSFLRKAQQVSSCVIFFLPPTCVRLFSVGQQACGDAGRAP